MTKQLIFDGFAAPISAASNQCDQSISDNEDRNEKGNTCQENDRLYVGKTIRVKILITCDSNNLLYHVTAKFPRCQNG